MANAKMKETTALVVGPNIVPHNNGNQTDEQETYQYKGKTEERILFETGHQISADDWAVLIAQDLKKLNKALIQKEAAIDPLITIEKMQRKLNTLSKVLRRTAPGPTQLSLFVEK